MPNHIQNRLRIIGPSERVKEIFSLIKSDEEEAQIDFEKIIPTPQVIKDVDNISFDVENAVKAFVDAPLSDNPLVAALQAKSRESATLPKEKQKQFELALKAYKETGFVYWYDWNIAHWGTKWNAYDQNDKRNTEDTIFFQTAWSAPLPVIQRLAQIFSDVEIHVDYADEDSGSNAGRIICRDGRAYVSKLDSQSIEAYELYFELNPDDRDRFELVNGKYQYKEEA